MVNNCRENTPCLTLHLELIKAESSIVPSRVDKPDPAVDFSLMVKLPEDGHKHTFNF